MLNLPLEPQQPQRPRRGTLRSALGFALLMVGALLAQIGRVLVEVGQLWGGRQVRDSLGRAVAHFYGTAPERTAGPARSGQQTFVRFGSAVILSIVSVWALMWAVMLLGAPLAWLALNGYGAWLLLGCVLLGALIGCWLAYLHTKSAHRGNLN